MAKESKDKGNKRADFLRRVRATFMLFFFTYLSIGVIYWTLVRDVIDINLWLLDVSVTVATLHGMGTVVKKYIEFKKGYED